MKNILTYTFSLLLATALLGCYSFKGISIPPSANTFYVKDFSMRAPSAPANINQRFSEGLRAKVRNESRLTYDDTKPDLEFEGSITAYNVAPIAPQEGNTVSLNKLTITVNVSYTDNTSTDKDAGWTQSFSFFRDFDATIDLNGVEDDFIEEIFTQILENVFNKAFTNW